MLKKEDNFDNVEQHEQQKEVERHPSDHVPRPTSVTRKGAWIALAIVAFTLFMTIREINQTPANNPVTTIVFSDYLEPAKEINAQEFEKLYDEARRNKINFSRISKAYLSGDYLKPHRADTSSLSIQRDVDNDQSYLCLEDNKGTSKDMELLICGLYDLYTDIEYPNDFLKAVEENNADVNNEKIYLNDYEISRTKQQSVYYINGFYYSKELADLIVEWNKTKSFN